MNAESTHKLLARQVRRHFGSFEALPPTLLPFLQVVDQAYRQADEDRAMMEHSLETVSGELEDRLRRMQQAIGEREELQQTLAKLESTQEQLRQSQKMEAIGQLAGGVAHDFNNLLTVIDGNVALVVDTPELPDVARELLTEVTTATNRAAQLTSRLLAFSRKQTLRTSVFDLAETVQGLTSMLRRAIGPTIALQTDISSVHVRADRSQMDQVLLNLVINARDAMNGAGSLRVRCGGRSLADESRGVQGDTIPPGHYAMLCVWDSGPGIPAELHDRIFEPFFTTKAPGEGTGLGLSMVYGLVRQSGGYVRLESTPTDGTRIEILLPSHASMPTTPVVTMPAAGSSPIAPYSILVVDDEDAVRRLVCTVLQRQGFFVQDAANGREALGVMAVRESPLDLVITDIVMPEMGGRELAGHIHGLDAELPILFMSGYSREEMADHGGQLREGVTLLAKPFNVSQLLSAVRMMLPEGATPRSTNVPSLSA
ncbi:MAG: hypothetical protein RLZZ621_452 [Gemmatimonadota bacterium]|jgi:signal transduction histidine kinase/ActR/RegA family two-component response regulator